MVYVMEILAQLKADAAAHSRCLRRICAARINDLVVFNGPGNLSCTGLQGDCGCMHAEARLIATMLKRGTLETVLVGVPTTLLTTLSPCVACAHLIGESGFVTRWLYLRQYRETKGIQIVRNYGIEIRSATSRD